MARRRKSVWPYLILTLAVVGAGIAWRGSDLGSAAADLERQRAAARREGVPMEWNDVRRLSPPVPDEINAAALYVPAFEGLANDRKVANQETLRALFKGTAKPEQIEEARRELAKVVSRLEDVKAASRRKAFSMDRQWERGWELLFPEYAQARTASRALIMRALLSKDPASATDDLRAVARMRAHFGSEPVLIAALVGNSIESDVHSAVRTLGRRGGAWPTALGPVLGDLGPIPSLKRTLTSEAVSGMRFDEQLAKTDMKALGYPTESSMPLALRFMKVPAVRDASMTRVTEF